MVTRQVRFRWLTVLSVLVLVAGLTACTGRLASDLESDKVAEAAQALKAASEAQGLEAEEGYFQLWDIEQCLESVKVLGGCDFNNPTAPYLFPVVPYWPEEHVDSGLAGAFGRRARWRHPSPRSMRRSSSWASCHLGGLLRDAELLVHRKGEFGPTMSPTASQRSGHQDLPSIRCRSVRAVWIMG